MICFNPFTKFDITPVKTLGGTTFTRVGRLFLFAGGIVTLTLIWTGNATLQARENSSYQTLMMMDQDDLLSRMSENPEKLASMLNAIEPE